MKRPSQLTARPRERVLVCGVILPGQPEEHAGALAELRELLRAADVDPVGSGIIQHKDVPDSATLMGKGKVAEIGEEVEQLKPDAVAVDNDLSPAHIRNLEKAWGVRVLDRSEVILDIFAKRARTGQARLQVELAQAEYLLPRLKRMWTHLERMEGAVGTRGPGETQLETDKRLLRKRVTDLRRELAVIAERRQREVRSRSEQFTIGLVGYTNAGKSTLLNRLTGSDELAADMLFATLDTRTRQWRLEDGRSVLLSDTVGFLQRLPHHLVASFHATLEETLHADLLLHVVDASHPDAATQILAVDEVLDSIAWADRREVLVFNKVDRVVEPLALHSLAEGRRNEVLFVSAHTGAGLDRLTQTVLRELDSHSLIVHVQVPLADGRSAALVRASGAITSEELIGDEALRFEIKLSAGALGNLRRGLAPDVQVQVHSMGRAVSESERALAELRKSW
jgi:GTP-binding protein HflX